MAYWPEEVKTISTRMGSPCLTSQDPRCCKNAPSSVHARVLALMYPKMGCNFTKGSQIGSSSFQENRHQPLNTVQSAMKQRPLYQSAHIVCLLCYSVCMPVASLRFHRAASSRYLTARQNADDHLRKALETMPAGTLDSTTFKFMWTPTRSLVGDYYGKCRLPTFN